MGLIDVYDVGFHLPAYVALAAALACVLLLPLYFSQQPYVQRVISKQPWSLQEE